MRPRDPRRLFLRNKEVRARVKLVQLPESGSSSDGSVTTKQVADVTLPQSELERIWNTEYLERLARTYWLWLSRISLGLLRVIYTPDSREIVFLRKPFVLLRFFAPEYDTSDRGGSVTWPINSGLLVQPHGRGKGHLRITVEKCENQPPEGSGEVTLRVSSEVGNFYPMIAGWGWFSKVGRHVYRLTQLAIHVVVTNAFLRSLASLDLAESVIGRFRRRHAQSGRSETPAPPPPEKATAAAPPADAEAESAAAGR
jgi:hypothetical protein